MAYDKEFQNKDWCGGPFPDRSVRKGNSPRPQWYNGAYVTDIPGNLSRPSDDGREHADIAPKQGFRKDLPAARDDRSDPSLLDGSYNGTGPSFDKLWKTWQ